MKLKTARIIVESMDETNTRWSKALKGKLKSKPNQVVISLESWELLGKLMSPSRLKILAEILVSQPKSIAELARTLKKDFKNVHTDVQFLADIGLLELKETGTRKTLQPIAKYKEIEVPFAA